MRKAFKNILQCLFIILTELEERKPDGHKEHLKNHCPVIITRIIKLMLVPINIFMHLHS
jgi:hypothetical protein